MKTRKRFGQDSFRLANKDIEIFITENGGQMGPVTFDRKNRKIQPFSVAPWAEESLAKDTPTIIKALRGDFFCMPFGGNDTTYRGERHPIHGETANAKWEFESLNKSKNTQELNLSLNTRIRKGRVDKSIRLIQKHDAIYVRHQISEMSGKMNFGHHAMLQFPEKPGSGLISTSRFIEGRTCPVLAENPEEKGYSSLKPNEVFKKLSKVKMQNGTDTDLSVFPNRRGFEDIVMTVADDQLPFAWTAVAFPKEGYVWFSLKDPQVLRQTVFWISNGGRHYEPWNGRHLAVMGLEDVTSYFHFGLNESSTKNPVSESGFPTSVSLKPKKTFTVNYIMGVAKIPRNFTRIKSIKITGKQQITLKDEKGQKQKAVVDVQFLRSQRS